MSNDIAKPTTTTDEKLDEIILHLKRMDKRDRMRMWGSTLHTIITLIPLVLLVVSSWYFLTHWQDVMKQVTSMAPSSAAEYTKNQSQGFFDSIMKQYAVPKK